MCDHHFAHLATHLPFELGVVHHPAYEIHHPGGLPLFLREVILAVALEELVVGAVVLDKPMGSDICESVPGEFLLQEKAGMQRDGVLPLGAAVDDEYFHIRIVL